MDKNSQYFIELVTAFLKETVPPKPINIDWNKIYNLASNHFLNGAIYLAVQRLEKEDKPENVILNKLKADFFATTLRYENQEKAYQEIKNKLNEEHIEHLFIKGTVLRKYYPVKQMRILGDIDLLLHEQDQKIASEALTQIGYENITTNTDFHWQYEKRSILVEVHDKLMYDEINSKPNLISYFESVWDNIIIEENSYTYKLNMEYHLIFLINHIAKHFYHHGAGVRMFLDIAVIINKFGSSLDFTYVLKELKKIKLDVFAENIFALCGRWFEVAVPNKIFSMDDGTFKIMSKYILESGTFGFTSENETFHMIKKEYEKTDNHKLARVKTFMGMIFLNYKDMKIVYPFLEKYPFLLPLTWIFRGINRITKKTNRTICILKGLTRRSNDVNELYAMMKKIGIY